MATTKFVNRARMTTSTTGTGSSVTLVVAVPRYFSFDEAGLQDGDVVDYIIEDGEDFEIQHDQTYSSSGPSLSRGTPAQSKVGGTAGISQINLSGGAQVAIVGLAKSFDVSTFTEKSAPAGADFLWGHDNATGERRAIPVSGVVGLTSGFRNKIINGDGRINQRVASTIGDDTYGHDRHYALTQTGNITVSTLTAPADGIASMMRLTQSQPSAQRMGYAQILEAIETYGLRGKTVTLGGKLRYSNAAAVRFAVLEWTGTADSVTSDVVNDWTSSTYTAGNFFLASNLTVAAVGSITPTANAITDWSLTATISASANNIIVFFWTEGTAAQNSTLDMRWYLVEGDATGEDDPFSPRHPATELYLCKRYAQRFGFGVACRANTTSSVGCFVTCNPEMRAPPAFSLVGTGAFTLDNGTAAKSAVAPVADAGSSEQSAVGGRLFVTGFSGLNIGEMWFVDDTARYLFLDAEL